ncbi:MAG: hypothetical protein ACRD4Q_14140, partial [Candidatus Acidiferrales bacterium]
GSGIYEGYGLGARLIHHVIEWDRSKGGSPEKRTYKPKTKWTPLSAIYTIGFPPAHDCLAAALEIYLISELQPSFNVEFSKGDTTVS